MRCNKYQIKYHTGKISTLQDSEASMNLSWPSAHTIGLPKPKDMRRIKRMEKKLAVKIFSKQ